MNYSVLQCAVTTQKQAEFPDGVITKVGNDKYTLEEATTKWHQQCVALRNDADTLKYKCAVIDSQLNIVDNLTEFVVKPIPEPEPEPTPEPTEE